MPVKTQPESLTGYKMKIQRLLDIIRQKKSKYCVTLRGNYSGQSIQEQRKDFSIRFHTWNEHFKIKSLLTISLAKLLLLKINEPTKQTQQEHATQSCIALPFDEHVKAVSYIKFL